MFGNDDMIAASRKFVCVRIDTYESKENEKLVRQLMDGVFVNTAFCLFAPDGKTQLSLTGRSITRHFTGGRDLDRVSRRFDPAADVHEAITPDFHSFRLALNIAAADQRMLVLITAPDDEIDTVERRMRKVAWHEEIVGRFHFDLETDASRFQDKLQFVDELPLGDNASGVFLIQPGTFGLDGKVLAHLPLDVNDAELRKAMLAANTQFAQSTERKTYDAHVAEGRRQGIYFEMAVPYGEDRDADGEIDANHRARFERVREWAEKTGKLVPVD